MSRCASQGRLTEADVEEVLHAVARVSVQDGPAHAHARDDALDERACAHDDDVAEHVVLQRLGALGRGVEVDDAEDHGEHHQPVTQRETRAIRHGKIENMMTFQCTARVG